MTVLTMTDEGPKLHIPETIHQFSKTCPNCSAGLKGDWRFMDDGVAYKCGSIYSWSMEWHQVLNTITGHCRAKVYSP